MELSIDVPRREPMEIPALASIFTSFSVLIPQSNAVETSPSKLLAPLTSEYSASQVDRETTPWPLEYVLIQHPPAINTPPETLFRVLMQPA